MNYQYLIVLIIMLIYWMGYIPYTERYYERRFREYYTSFLNARSCDDIRNAMQKYFSCKAFVDYLDRNEESFHKRYPLDRLKDKLNQLNCDSDMQLP
jgi:hypothetical protein